MVENRTGSAPPTAAADARASTADGERKPRRPYTAPVLTCHGRLRDLVREGNTIPAPDPFTGLSNQGT